MQYEIKPTSPIQNSITIIKFEISERESPSVFKHWKTMLMSFVIGCLFTSSVYAWYIQQGQPLSLKWQSNRSTTVVIGNKDDEAKNHVCSNGTTTTSP